MNTFKKYVLEFALFMILWMSFSALMEIAYKDDFQLWMKYIFAFLITIIVDVFGGRLFNNR